MSKYLDLDIKDIHELLCSGSIKPIDLVNEAFDRIESDELNCFISTSKEYATNRAKALEGEKPTGLLWGIPIAIKDNIVTKDLRLRLVLRCFLSFSLCMMLMLLI